MLPSRLSRHLAKQDWFAVFLDLVIVILGVYLGLQATTWSEHRAERALEAEYLQRIHDELRGARAELHTIVSDANASRLYAPELSAFLNGEIAASDPQALVVAIYKFSLDPLDVGFDMSTFEDLVSTGRLRLIADPKIRKQIQVAYAELHNFAPFRNPYRHEYRFALSGLIPTSVGRRILAACPNDGSHSSCPGLDLDDETARSIVDRIDRSEARLAFNNRDRGFGAVAGKGGSILEVLDDTILLLEQGSTR